ncbi:uncharacterized protein LOC135169906 [Diachasmimorpha longicaudata]|uniref:uncharacterized protein LOC135169906 n=1 Tax=Diachasmimorpha longicaudata TaxID=58733 RepID=UPI0030B911FC
MESPSEGLHSPRPLSTYPSRLKGEKYSKPHVDSLNVTLTEHPEVSLDRYPPKFATYPVHHNSERASQISNQVEQSHPPEPVHHIVRRKWNRNRLNRLRSILMKSHVRNNEKRRSDADVSSHMTNSAPDAFKKLKPNQDEKIPFHSEDSGPSEDLQSLHSSKIIDLVTPRPRIIIDRFKIPPDIARNFVNRKLLHFITDRDSKMPPQTPKQVEPPPIPQPIRHIRKKWRKNHKFINRRLLHSPRIENPPSRDFAISLTGKIHVDGEANSGPMSITFDTGDPPNSLPLKINRRSAEGDVPQEIVPRRPLKTSRSDSIKNLISNELPENDSTDLETVTTVDRIRPFALPDEPSPPPLPSNRVQSPVNLKIIGLISMSNPSAPKSEPERTKGWGDVNSVSTMSTKQERGSSLPPETPARPETPATSVPPSTMTPKWQSELPETVTFIIDSDDETPNDTNSQTCPLVWTKGSSTAGIGRTSSGPRVNDNKLISSIRPIQMENDDSAVDGVTRSDDTEEARLGNMLAVMEFISKMKRILTGENCQEEPGTVIRLQKFVITPENASSIEDELVRSGTSRPSSPGGSGNTQMPTGVPRQTYITRIINRPKSSRAEALETLGGELIEYLARADDSGERRAGKMGQQFSLDSEGASENNRQVGREISSDAGPRDERTRRKRWRRRKKKKKKKKWFRRFGRQLMSLDAQDVLDEIYDDEGDVPGRSVGSGYRGRSKRESASGFQIRGGQNCMDRRHPPNVNPEKYLESAHCLRFSDLWYSVYKLGKPVVEHGVFIQIFKRGRENTGWRDLTRGEMIRLGTFTRHQRDKTPTIVFTYIQEKLQVPESSLNSNTQRLLIPLGQNNDKKSEGMSEYLIIPSNQITSEGRECDKAGVGFSAFVMQKDRCARKRGSCLRNQPLDYWRHDVNARQSGKPGCYFLSNFAEVPVNPIKYNVTDTSEGREYLSLVQNSHHVSTLEIEVRADDNNVIATGSAGRITEVHVIGTADVIKMSIRLTNTGLVSSDYQARIVDCPSGLPNSWAHPITRKYRVPPQHDSLVTLDIPGRISIDGFECNVEVINYRGELVAARRIIVHKMNRCFCLWHCICTCYESHRGFSCLPMTPEHYHQAGFRGPVPAINPRTSSLFKGAIDIIIIIIVIFAIFLALGIAKWIIGVLSPPVGRWGLDNLVAGLKIDEYIEPELKCRCVITDDEGIPIHPDTGRRTVRLCSKTAEFFINSLFLFIYPCCILCDCMGKIAKCRHPERHDDSKDRLIDKDGMRIISVRSYGDMKNSKLEQEDTELFKLMSVLEDILILSALGLVVLLTLGVLKWLGGFCIPGLSQWGLDTLLEGTKIDECYTAHSRCKCLVNGDKENLIHSNCSPRTIRICSRKLELLLNFVFFLTYPIAACCQCTRACGKKRGHYTEESKMSLITGKKPSPGTISVPSYGECKNSRLETEDTQYVVQELKNSGETLAAKKHKKQHLKPRRSSSLSGKLSRKTSSVQRLVNDLLGKRIVFRNLRESLGDLKVPQGKMYSLRGYFMNAEDNGFRFITPCPFKQHWVIDADGAAQPCTPPLVHQSSLFMKNFKNAKEIYESNEMSLIPRAVCINVPFLTSDLSE